MEDNDGDSFTRSLVDLALGKRRPLFYKTTADAQNAIAGTLCSLLAILSHIPEKRLLMELLASLDQTNAAQSVRANTLCLNVDKVRPGVGKESHLFLEIKQ